MHLQKRIPFLMTINPRSGTPLKGVILLYEESDSFFLV